MILNQLCAVRFYVVQFLVRPTSLEFQPHYSFAIGSHFRALFVLCICIQGGRHKEAVSTSKEALFFLDNL